MLTASGSTAPHNCRQKIVRHAETVLLMLAGMLGAPGCQPSTGVAPDRTGQAATQTTYDIDDDDMDAKTEADAEVASLLWSGIDAVRDYRTGQAKDAFSAVLRIRPGHVAAHHHLGDALMGESKYDQAITQYKEALQRDPNALGALTGLACAYYYQDKYLDAERVCRQAVATSPESAVAHLTLGHVWSIQGRIQEAIDEYKTAIRLKPYWARSHRSLARAYSKLGLADNMVDTLKEVVRLDPSDIQTQRRIASACYTRGRLEEAVETCNRIIRSYPEDSHALHLLGDTLYRLERYKEATAAYRRAVRIEPDNTSARLYMGLAYVWDNNGPEAMKVHAGLKERDSDSADYLMRWIKYKRLNRRKPTTAPAATAGGTAAGPAEEKLSFDVILKSGGDNKIDVIKAVRAATHLGLKDAKDLVEGAPKTVKEGLPKDEAEKLKKELEEVGATVEIK